MTKVYRYPGVLLTVLLIVSPVRAGELHPLASCDASSPRAMLESFQRITGQAMRYNQEDDWSARYSVEKLLDKAMRCLDVSRIPRERIDDEGEAAVILLQEVLDRIEIPPYPEIPDAKTVREEEIFRWTLPNTEIEIAKVEEGPRKGEWLVSPETLARLKEFYRDVENFPYRADAVWGAMAPLGGAYPNYVLYPEPSMPDFWIDDLPVWARAIYLEQPVWKWLGMALVLLSAAGIFTLVWQVSQRADRRRQEDASRRYWPRLLPPVTAVILVYLAEHLIDEYINAAGTVDTVNETLTLVVFFLCLAWVILKLGNIVAEAIIRSPRIQPRSVDASMITITARVVSFVIAVWVVVEGTDRLGLSLVPLIAGLGVGGLAIALAVRPTFENLIGGFILYADKPVRVGDRCIFGNQEGFVERIGLRSTRIRTLKDTLVSIPNAEFSQLQLENVSSRKVTLYQTVLGLRYETTVEQLRYVLVRLREMLVGHPEVPPERLRVRFLRFGDYSLDIEIFAYVRTSDFDEYWAIREDINLRIMDIVSEAGTGFAFPSSTAYFTEDAGLDTERSREAETQVQRWRAKGRLPFPEFDERQLLENEDTLDYPPKGSSLSASLKEPSMAVDNNKASQS